ncbi:MAG TPA: ABC-2 family transporter protein [Candidatus Methylomirabilis sp.]|nr:ABC-2 family transporter protein [Candidatus Methylomirabilis sp.]
MKDRRPSRLAVYGHLVRAQVKSQAQYRTSLAIDVGGSMALGVLDILSVVVFFRATSALAGFAFHEVFLMTTLASCAFSVADLAVGNVERLRVYVRTGLFDAVLVRPLGTLLQLLAMDVAPRRVGRLVFGVALIATAAVQARVLPTPAHLVLLVITPLAGAVIFSAVFVATSTVSFWWIEAGEFANALTYGGHDFAAYPLGIYGALLRRMFAYGLGFAFVAYYPALALLDRPDPLKAPAYLGYASPLIALGAAAIAALFWRRGVRHYRSTGS